MIHTQERSLERWMQQFKESQFAHIGDEHSNCAGIWNNEGRSPVFETEIVRDAFSEKTRLLG